MTMKDMRFVLLLISIYIGDQKLIAPNCGQYRIEDREGYADYPHQTAAMQA